MQRRLALVMSMIAACGGAGVPPVGPPRGAAPVAEPPAPKQLARATKVRTVEGITEYRLDNGLQVLLFPDPSQSTVTVNITYLVGSRVEGYGETGMAHLLEHMMFKGTPSHRNVLGLLDARGAVANGTTWTDRTNYYETLPATQDNLDFALELEADRMIHASISPDDLRTEFSVVRNEFEAGENDPSAVLAQRVVATAFLWHNYGKDTIGSRADIERVPVPALRAFYEKYYQPDNAVLIVSGRYDELAALAKIEATFGAIPRPARALTPSYTVEPPQDGERTVTLRRTGDVHVVTLAYHTVGAASPDYAAVEAALDVLVREPSGRLYKALVEPQLAATLAGEQLRFRDPYVATLSATVRDGKHADRVERAMIDAAEKLGAGAVDDREVARWRNATQKELELAFTNSQQIAVELSEFAALGDWRTLFAYRDRVAAVTAADVQRVASTYFKASNRTSGRFVPVKTPDRAPLTETPDVAAIVKDIEGTRAAMEPGEAFAATLDNIEARTQRRELANGIRAAFLPKKTRGGRVQLALSLHWGDEKSLQGKRAVAQLAAALMKRGTAKRTYQAIHDLEDELRADIAIAASGASGLTLRIQTLRDKLAAALDLGAEMLVSPSFPEKELELVRQEALAALEAQLQDPAALAWATAAQLVSPWPAGDPRRDPTPAEEIEAIKKVTAADIRAFHRELVGAGHGELAVVGDHDPAAIGAQVDKLLAGWTSKRPYARLAQRAFGVAGTSTSIDVKDKEMTQLVVMHDLAMRDTDPDYPAWLMAGYVLGGDTGSRVWMRLREKEGLSYGAGAWASAGALDESGTFGAHAIVAPQNLAKAKASLLEEIAKLASGKVTAEELKRAVDGWVKYDDTQLSNDAALVAMLQQQSYHGRTTAQHKELRAKIQALAPADVERVAKARLAPGKLVVVDAGDTSKAK
ncbi:MAG: insulinase family protein [Deltaproteobacteria bacterium]|nr:insulinase family protein [Deltaproteobacteria bacterium]